MFKNICPEYIGVSSERILKMIRAMDRYNFSTHSIIMSKGEDIFFECYYAPFDKNFKHRSYSVSKSFITLAVGVAEREGLLNLDDHFMKFFPEYDADETDKRFFEMTVRDMLSMRTCMADYAIWWGKDDRAAAYFTKLSNQIPGTNYDYDSPGAFMVGCIVEKVTGKPLLEYLKEKLLLELGFSNDSYCLFAPGGYSHSDSGIMCTARDLLIVARLFMNGGVYNGKRYLSEEFVKSAISKQTDNYLGSSLSLLKNNGYGYFIWKLPRDGFAMYGMAGQMVICDPKTDFVFVMQSENMGCEATVEAIVMHELYENIIPSIGASCEINANAADELEKYIAGAKLMSLRSSNKNDFAKKINGKIYVTEENKNGIEYFKLSFEKNNGILEFKDETGVNKLTFGMGYNELGKFPGALRMGTTASRYVEGRYDCACSAAWCERQKLHILAQVIDEYMGKVHIVIAFKDDRASVSLTKQSQRILDNYSGKLVAKVQ